MRKILAVFLMGCLLAWLGYYGSGTRLSGEASSPAEIPIVGGDLTELTFTGPASYRGFEHPHGGGSLNIAGPATAESVARFCDAADLSLSRKGTDIMSRAEIVEHLRGLEIAIDGLIDNGASAVIFGMEGRFETVYGVYDSSSRQLVLALEFARRR